MVAAEMVAAEMVATERKIHQKKENKIPYFLFVSRLHELTKATQFFDLFGEDSDFNEGPPSQPSPEQEFENSSFLPTPEPTDYCSGPSVFLKECL